MIHLQKLDPTKVHYIVRHFADTKEDPLGELEPVTGQPWKEYDGTCVLTIHGNAGEIQAILHIPDGAFGELKEVALNQLQLKRLVGERWLNKRRFRRDIPLTADADHASLNGGLKGSVLPGQDQA